jgi:predicted DNA-binding transcriptional regulator YafY
MARNEQLIRQHKIMQLLEASRYGRTLDELRDELVRDLGLSNLHERTVRRDVEALTAAGLDIRSESLERGKVYMLGRVERGLHKISVSSTELIALSIGRELLFPLLGTQYWQGIESFWSKLHDSVPEGVWDHYQKYRKSIHVFGTLGKTYEKHEGILRTLNRAIAEHRIVEIEYKPTGKPAATRQIEPYGLAVYQSSIYVVAVATEVTDPADRLRHWKLDRFLKATALDRWFKPDPGIDLNEHLSRSIGMFSSDTPVAVQIRLGESAAAWVTEDPWHPDQVLRPIDGDRGAVMLTVPASHPRELLPKVLSLGGDAEVVAPASFRDAVADAVQKMAAKYHERSAVAD